MYLKGRISRLTLEYHNTTKGKDMIPIDNITPTSQKNIIRKMFRPTIREAIRALEEAEVKLGLKICTTKRIKAFGW